MKDLSLDNITSVAVDSLAGTSEPRLRELLESLVVHLHQYAKKVHLTHAEWRAALAFLHRCGEISNATRSEFALLSDVLGASTLIDLLATQPGATPGSVLGPFHAIDSPWRENPVNLVGSNDGQRVLLRGRVNNVAGRPLPNATLDFWQNANNGLYWQMDPAQPLDNLRGQMRVDPDGRFAIATIRPQPYPIPTDGPVWKDVVAPAGRSAWRPAHFHLIVGAPGYQTLVTELFDAQDPYLQTDAVFGVRDALVGHYHLQEGPETRLLVGDGPIPVMEVELRLATSESGDNVTAGEPCRRGSESTVIEQLTRSCQAAEPAA